MNYYSKGALALTFSLFFALSGFSQCGNISFGPIVAEDEGGYSVEVILSQVTSLSGLTARITFPIGLVVEYDDDLSEAESPAQVILNPLSGSAFRIGLTGSASSIPGGVLAKIYFAIPFGDCVNSLMLSNVSFFTPGGGCSSNGTGPGLLVLQNTSTQYCPPSRSVFGSLEGVIAPAGINAPASTSDYYGANFAAIKIGDVTGDCALNGGRDGEEGNYTLEEIILADRSFAANETALVAVYANTDIDLSLFGYTLNFAEDLLEVTNVLPGQLVDFESAFRIVPREENRVSFVWFPYGEIAQTIDADEPLFFLELKALSAITTLEGTVTIENHGNLAEGRNGLHRTSLRIANTTESPLVETVSQLTVTPNPFADRYTTSLFVTETQTCSIEVYNMQGQRVHRRTVELIAGENILTSDDLNDFPTGTYVQKIVLSDQTLTSTLIKQ
jgi:hypothetical protein